MDRTYFHNSLVEWLELHKINLQSSTYNSYFGIVKNASAYFKEKNILTCNITAKDINLYYAHLSKSGLSNNRIVKYHSVLYTCLKSLIDDDILTTSVLHKIKRPKTQTHLAKVYTQKGIEINPLIFKLNTNDFINYRNNLFNEETKDSADYFINLALRESQTYTEAYEFEQDLQELLLHYLEENKIETVSTTQSEQLKQAEKIDTFILTKIFKLEKKEKTPNKTISFKIPKNLHSYVLSWKNTV